jgi:hypothetical protein
VEADQYLANVTPDICTPPRGVPPSVDTDLDTKRFGTRWIDANRPDRLEANWLVKGTQAHSCLHPGTFRSA